MEEALSCVRKQAQLDQEGLVDFIWSIHCDFNGSAPSAEDMASVFGRIREQFAADAREEFLERNEHSDSDSAYSEESSDSEDEVLDIYVSGDDDAASSAESECWSEMDGEYDAEEDDAEEYWNDVVDDEELALWASGIEEWSGSAVSTDDEEQLVASSLFAAEWCSAIEHIEDLAKGDQQSMLSAVWGGDDQATPSMVEEAMDSVAAALVQYESSDDAAPSELENGMMPCRVRAIWGHCTESTSPSASAHSFSKRTASKSQRRHWPPSSAMSATASLRKRWPPTSTMKTRLSTPRHSRRSGPTPWTTFKASPRTISESSSANSRPFTTRKTTNCRPSARWPRSSM